MYACMYVCVWGPAIILPLINGHNYRRGNQTKKNKKKTELWTINSAIKNENHNIIKL